MKLYEIGTGYTPIPAQMGAATEIVVEGLTRAFLKQNVPVEIVDIRAKNRSETDLPIRETWVPACFSGTDVKLGLMHKLKRVVYSVSLACTLRRILKESDEKIVLHFHNQYNLFFFLKLTPAKLRTKACIAYTNHSGVWRQGWKEIERTIQKRYFQESACMKHADILFLLNRETKENVVNHLGVSEDRIVLIGNGVDTDVYCPLDTDTKAQFGLTGKNVFLQVGSVCENKGQLRSVQYLLPLLKENPDLVYAYAGGIVEPDYAERVRKFAGENGVQEQVRYLGMMVPGKILNELYNTALATILPSGFESFGLVAIESMAAGVPVLLDKKSPMDFGAGCLRYEEENFVETAALLFGEEAAALAADARRNACANYSWDAVAAEYAQEFKNRMKKHG